MAIPSVVVEVPGPQGPQGPQGEVGPQGPVGPTGIQSRTPLYTLKVSGPIYYSPNISLNTETGIFTCPGHELVDGDPVGLHAEAATNFCIPTNPYRSATAFYVVNCTPTTFQVSLSMGGAPLDFTSPGVSGSWSLRKVMFTGAQELISVDSYQLHIQAHVRAAWFLGTNASGSAISIYPFTPSLASSSSLWIPWTIATRPDPASFTAWVTVNDGRITTVVNGGVAGLNLSNQYVRNSVNSLHSSGSEEGYTSVFVDGIRQMRFSGNFSAGTLIKIWKEEW